MTDNEQQLNIVDEEQQVDLQQVNEEHIDDDTAAVKKKRTKWEIAVNVALWVAIAVLVVMVALRLFVFSSVRVDGDSMNNTYQGGDVVVVNKLATPKRGDVVVIYLNDVDNKFKAQFAKDEDCAQGGPYEKLIKRVVATAGDKIWAQSVSESENLTLYEVVIETADGDRLYEDYYVKKGTKLSVDDFRIKVPALTTLGLLEGHDVNNPLVVSENCVFIMGDHRENSRDSREFGEFPLSRMFGVVLDK